eukprot:15133845-Ditylum_brightwellii.AAC.1
MAPAAVSPTPPPFFAFSCMALLMAFSSISLLNLLSCKMTTPRFDGAFDKKEVVSTHRVKAIIIDSMVEGIAAGFAFMALLRKMMLNDGNMPSGE